MNTQALLEVLPIEAFVGIGSEERKSSTILRRDLSQAPDPASVARIYKQEALARFRSSLVHPLKIERLHLEEEDGDVEPGSVFSQRDMMRLGTDYSYIVYAKPFSPFFTRPFRPFRTISLAFGLAYVEFFILGGLNYRLPPSNPFAEKYNRAREVMFTFYKVKNIEKYPDQPELTQLRERKLQLELKAKTQHYSDYPGGAADRDLVRLIHGDFPDLVTNLCYLSMGYSSDMATTYADKVYGSTVPSKMMFELLIRSGMDPRRLEALFFILFVYSTAKQSGNLLNNVYRSFYGRPRELLSSTPDPYELQLGPRPFFKLEDLEEVFEETMGENPLTEFLEEHDVSDSNYKSMRYIHDYLSLVVADFKQLLNTYVEQFNSLNL